MAAAPKGIAWLAGGLMLAGGAVSLGLVAGWSVAAVVGGLVETAYFGLLPLSIARWRSTAAIVPSGNDAVEAGHRDTRPSPVPEWSDELSDVLDQLTLCLPDPLDIDQVADQAGIPRHLIDRSGDKAANRWQELVDRARIEGGDRKLALVFTRAIRRSESDPRLIAAVDRWRRVTVQSR